jgi:hypothetical protein
VRLLLRLLTVQICPDTPDTKSHADHIAKAEPLLGTAVSVIVVPEAKLAPHVQAQLRPGGALVTVPDPLPAKSTVKVSPEKHTTLAVMYPVTRAPCDEIFPLLRFVVTVAEMRASPHATPAALSTPAELTVAMSGVFEAQVNRARNILCRWRMYIGTKRPKLNLQPRVFVHRRGCGPERFDRGLNGDGHQLLPTPTARHNDRQRANQE